MRTELLCEHTQFYDRNEYINSNKDFFPDIEKLKSQGTILVRRYSSYKYNYHIGMSYVDPDASCARKLIFRGETHHINHDAATMYIYLCCYKHYIYFELHIAYFSGSFKIVFLNTCMKTMIVPNIIVSQPKLQTLKLLKLYLSKLCK